MVLFIGLDELKKELKMDSHIISLSELCLRYKTDPDKGKTKADAMEDLRIHGLNRFENSIKAKCWEKLL